MENERMQIYRNLENKLLKMGEERGRVEERINWIMAINHLIEIATKYNWDKKRTTYYTGALKDLKKKMKAMGIENLFTD